MFALSSDTTKCLRYIAFYGTNTHFIFIGDTKIQDLYIAFVHHLKEDDEAIPVAPPPQELMRNLTHLDNKLKLKVEFYAAPTVSKDMIDKFR